MSRNTVAAVVRRCRKSCSAKTSAVAILKKWRHAQFTFYSTLHWKNRQGSASDTQHKITVPYLQAWHVPLLIARLPCGPTGRPWKADTQKKTTSLFLQPSAGLGAWKTHLQLWWRLSHGTNKQTQTFSCPWPPATGGMKGTCLQISAVVCIGK